MVTSLVITHRQILNGTLMTFAGDFLVEVGGKMVDKRVNFVQTIVVATISANYFLKNFSSRPFALATLHHILFSSQSPYVSDYLHLYDLYGMGH